MYPQFGGNQNKYMANQGSQAFINISKAGLSLLGQTF